MALKQDQPTWPFLIVLAAVALFGFLWASHTGPVSEHPQHGGIKIDPSGVSGPLGSAAGGPDASRGSPRPHPAGCLPSLPTLDSETGFRVWGDDCPSWSDADDFRLVVPSGKFASEVPQLGDVPLTGSLVRLEAVRPSGGSDPLPAQHDTAETDSSDPPAPADQSAGGMLEFGKIGQVGDSDTSWGSSAQWTTNRPEQPSIQLSPEKVAALSLSPDAAQRAAGPDEQSGQSPAFGLSALTSAATGPAMSAPEASGDEQWADVWPRPATLLEQLEALRAEPALLHWSDAVFAAIDQLWNALRAKCSVEQEQALARLDELAQQADRLLPELTDPHPLNLLRQARHALGRRLHLWRTLSQWDHTSPGADADDSDLPRRLASALSKVRQLLGDSQSAEAWWRYLELDRLESQLQEPGGWTPASELLARRILRRLAYAQSASDRKRLLDSAAFAELGQVLATGVQRPSARAILALVEEFEQLHQPSTAASLGEVLVLLRASGTPQVRAVGEAIDAGYRGANFRIAVSEQLLNRLIPERELEYRPVHDVIRGYPVLGDSLAETQVAFRLIPDPQRIRLALEVRGLVAAITSSIAGPAVFHNDSQSAYLALKELEFDLSGIRTQPAEVVVANEFWLRSLRTDFDPVPLLGALAQEIARAQHAESKYETKREVAQKLERQVRTQVNREADERFERLNARIRRHLLEAVEALSLGPEMVGAQTTRQRIIMQLRLAGGDQTAAGTARPWAPSDSLASCQVHESTLNNAIARLGFDGHTLTLTEVHRRLGELLRLNTMESDADDDRVEITFASQDALQVHFHDGQMAVRMAIAQLYRPPHDWRDFEVRAFYRPVAEGRTARMQRDGVVQLIGPHLKFRDQIALRGVFSKTFSKNRSWDLLPQWFAEHPKIADLEVTQLKIADGWLALAVGPARTTAATVAHGNPQEELR